MTCAQQSPLQSVSLGVVPLGLSQQGQGPQHSEHAATPDLGLELPVLAAAGHQGADPVTAGQRGPGDERRRFRGDDRFESHPGTEVHARTQVHQQDHRPLPLFLEQLGVGAAGARRHPPVDAANVVPRQIDTGLGELHAATAKTRQVGARHRLASAPRRAQVEALSAEAQPDEIVDPRLDTGQPGLAGWYGVHGTGTSLSSSSMTASESLPSASASKEIRTRWRRTSWAMDWTSSGDT